MDEYSLFTIASGFEKPWKVVEIKFSKDEGRLDLKLDFQKGATFPFFSCEEDRCPVHDTKERTWRHLKFFQYETESHAITSFFSKKASFQKPSRRIIFRGGPG